jgi:AraC-like DNA-binding protein
MQHDSSGPRQRPAPRDKIVPVQAISPLITLSFEQGWDRREMFPFVDFEDATAVVPGQALAYADCHEAFLRARRRLGETFAIDYAGRKSLAFLGVIGLGMLVQPTVGSALRFLLEFRSLAGSVLELEWELGEKETAIVGSDLFGGHELTPFWKVDHLATIAGAAEQLPCEDARPLRLELEGALPGPLRRAMSVAIGCPIAAPAERSRLVYLTETLRKPLRFPDAVAAAHWRKAAELEARRYSPPDAGSQVRRMVAAEGRLVGRQEVSRKLGVSERSLGRMLAREGLRFSDVTDVSRLQAAKALLISGETVGETAERLGYSDARSFRRAFRRMTGISPFDFQTSF